MEQVLCDGYCADDPVMATFGKEIAYVRTIALVQVIDQQDQSRFATRHLEFRNFPLIDIPSSGTGQLLARDGCFFAETPRDIAKIGHCTICLVMGVNERRMMSCHSL